MSGSKKTLKSSTIKDKNACKNKRGRLKQLGKTYKDHNLNCVYTTPPFPRRGNGITTEQKTTTGQKYTVKMGKMTIGRFY